MGLSRQEYWSGVPLPSRKIYCLSILQIYSMVLLSMAAMLNIASPWLTYFITGVCAFWPLYSSCLSSGSHQSILCIYELEIFGGPRNGILVSLEVRSYSIYISLSHLISFSIMPLGFVFHLVANGRISFFLWLNDIPVCDIFFIQSLFREHLGCFRILAIVNMLQWTWFGGP